MTIASGRNLHEETRMASQGARSLWLEERVELRKAFCVHFLLFMEKYVYEFMPLSGWPTPSVQQATQV
jgi:hypothetical protein